MIVPRFGNEWPALATRRCDWRLGLGIEFRAARVTRLRSDAKC